MTSPVDVGLRDPDHGVVLRRVVVGPLRTNCWVLHPAGGRDALLVDPGDEPQRILAAVADLRVRAVLLTHVHFDHVLALPDVADALGVPVLAHAEEAAVWRHEVEHLSRHGHFDAGTADLPAAALRPQRPLWNGITRDVVDGATLHLGPLTVTVLHTPGHTPGGLSVSAPGHLLTGDTLFPGGPGLTGWPLSDFATIMTSVRGLLRLPADTAVHPGHGEDTTLGRERPSIPEWEERGW